MKAETEELPEYEDAERWWNEQLMPAIARCYEETTDRKWIPGSQEVRDWIDKQFGEARKRREKPDA